MTMCTHFQKSCYFLTDFLNTVIPNQSTLFLHIIKIPICFQIRVKPHRGKEGLKPYIIILQLVLRCLLGSGGNLLES